MNKKTKRLRNLLKKNACGSLTLQLLEIPVGGKLVTLSDGTKIKVTASLAGCVPNPPQKYSLW